MRAGYLARSLFIKKIGVRLLRKVEVKIRGDKYDANGTQNNKERYLPKN